MLDRIKKRVSPYAPTLVVLVFGLVLFSLSEDAALVLIGGGLAYGLSTHQRLLADRRQSAEAERTGLDGRLLLMIGRCQGEPSPEMVASAINGLVYHHRLRSPAEVDLLGRSSSSGADATDQPRRGAS